MRPTLLFLSLTVLGAPALAQTFSHPGCNNLAAGDFRATELARGKGLQEPVAFDLQAVWNAARDSVVQVNIFFAQRLGEVKFFNGATGAVNSAGTVPVWAKTSGYGTDDNGLMGIAVDPDYASNRWIYLWYGPPPVGPANPRLRLSRFTITAQNAMDMASEKILIDILTSKGDHRHAGGPMTFDRHGDLWVTVGQSGNDINWPNPGSHFDPADSAKSMEWGPSSTASLRGGIFRIHPDNSTASRTDRSGKYGPGYSIPAGNFGEYWADQFQRQGKATLAAQYRDPAKVFPEVYVKGCRSNYSIGVHPTKRWVAWGEVNFENGYDEINVWAAPGFAGLPYFHANNVATPFSTKNAAAPTNTSPLNSGVTELPPALPGTLNWASGDQKMANIALSGPIYAYDRALKNRDKLPPHLDNHHFHMSFSGGMWINSLDSATGAIRQTQRVDRTLWNMLPQRSPLAARIGPDGAFYLLNYDGFYSTGSPGVARLGYMGSCRLEPVPVDPKTGHNAGSGILRGPTSWRVEAEGPHVFSLHSLQGRRLLSLSGDGPKEYPFARLRAVHGLPGGLYFARLKTASGETSGRVLLR